MSDPRPQSRAFRIIFGNPANYVLDINGFFAIKIDNTYRPLRYDQVNTIHHIAQVFEVTPQEVTRACSLAVVNSEHILNWMQVRFTSNYGNGSNLPQNKRR